MKAILFTNWSSEDFTGKWDSVDYPIKSGQQMMLQQYLAIHFARHLANRELNREGKPLSSGNREKYMAKAIANNAVVEAEDEAKLESKMMNLGDMNKDELKKLAEEKGIKVDGRKKEDTLRKELEEFEGLQDEEKNE